MAMFQINHNFPMVFHGFPMVFPMFQTTNQIYLTLHFVLTNTSMFVPGFPSPSGSKVKPYLHHEGDDALTLVSSLTALNGYSESRSPQTTVIFALAALYEYWGFHTVVPPFHFPSFPAGVSPTPPTLKRQKENRRFWNLNQRLASMACEDFIWESLRIYKVVSPRK